MVKLFVVLNLSCDGCTGTLVSIVTSSGTGHLEHIQINSDQTRHLTDFLKIFPYRACSDLSKNMCFKKIEGGEKIY